MNDNRMVFALIAAAGLVPFAAQTALADDAARGGLADCAVITDDGARLACFDALAARYDSEPEAPPPPAAPVAPAVAAESAPAAPPSAAESAPTPITDDVGRERIDGPSESESPVYTANVTRCEENQQSGQTYFFFENGQVWRQANYRRLRFRDCRFEVNLTEDNFGYSMYVPSEDRRFRVTRIR